MLIHLFLANSLCNRGNYGRILTEYAQCMMHSTTMARLKLHSYLSRQCWFTLGYLIGIHYLFILLEKLHYNTIISVSFNLKTLFAANKIAYICLYIKIFRTTCHAFLHKQHVSSTSSTSNAIIVCLTRDIGRFNWSMRFNWVQSWPSARKFFLTYKRPTISSDFDMKAHLRPELWHFGRDEYCTILHLQEIQFVHSPK